MKFRKSVGIMILTITLVLFFSGLAGAQILNNASQMVNLSSGGGVAIGSGGSFPNGVPFTQLLAQPPDGSTPTNPWTIPTGKVLVVTKIKYSFKLTTGTLAGPVILAIGPYYTKRFTPPTGTTPNTAADNDNLPTGFVINGTGWSNTNYVTVYNAGDTNKTPLIGTLNVTLLGFTAPNQ